jgi:DNA repair protein RecN (Recombination protein N)
MLKEIVIDSFALIDHLSLAFDAGFSALTGETGAGKSIVLDAISLLLGGRASSEMVRTGEEKAHILGLFDVPDQPTFNELWEEQGLPWPEDGQVVVTREITSSGKSVARINGRPVALATLRSIGSQLVELHGQHEHQTLFDAKQHLNILDQYGGNGHLRLLHDYRLSHQRWSACADEIKRLELDEREQMRIQDLW